MYTSFIEVIVLRYAIPAAITNRATELKEKLDILISKISNIHNTDDDDNDDSSNKKFTVTDWFYVSNYIAKKRLDIPESSIVLAYQSVSPKDISNKFNQLMSNHHHHHHHHHHHQHQHHQHHHHHHHDNDNNRNNCIFMIMIMMMDIANVLLKLMTMILLQIGVLPDFIQTVIIRITQVHILSSSSSLSSSLSSSSLLSSSSSLSSSLLSSQSY